MTLLLALLAPSPALAEEPVVSLAISEVLIDSLTGGMAGFEYEVQQENLSFAVGCWEELGVRDLALTIPFDGISVELHDDYMTVQLDLGTIRGEDWIIYAVDLTNDDSCLVFDADMAWLEFRDGIIEVDLRLASVDGALDIQLVNPPRMQGSIDMDVEWQPQWAEDWGFDWDWWPDDFFVDLINDYLLDAVIEMAADAVPGMLAELRPELAFQTEVGDFALDIDVAELGNDTERVLLDAAIDVTWTGQSTCGENAEVESDGRVPALDLTGTDLAFGTSEAFVNRLAYRAWSEGILCLDHDGVEGLVAQLFPQAAEVMDSFTVAIELREPPRISFQQGGLSARVHGLRLDLGARYQRKDVRLLDVIIDLSTALKVGVDEELAMVTLDVEALELDFDVREASHLLSDDVGAEQSLEDFLNRFAPMLLDALLTEVALAGVVFPAGDALLLRLEELSMGMGGVSGGVNLYGIDEVDRQPPETRAEITGTGAASISVDLKGFDDSGEALAWKHRLDAGEWSQWSLESVIEVPVAEPGWHTLEVAARDRWWNEDPTPWRESFALEALPTELDELGEFGCTSRPGRAPVHPAWLLAVLSLLLKRRCSPLIASERGEDRRPL